MILMEREKEQDSEANVCVCVFHMRKQIKLQYKPIFGSVSNLQEWLKKTEFLV